MKIIVGLGNPGKEYENTRHNVGFMAIDLLAKKIGIEMTQKKFDALIGASALSGEKIILMKPMTFMNLSGLALRQIMDFYHLTPSDFIILYDDTDLELGMIRIKAKGSSGGHNGVKSIIQHFGTETFDRIRVGIGQKKENVDLANHVLSTLTASDKKTMDVALPKVLDAILDILQNGISHAMNQYNHNERDA